MSQIRKYHDTNIRFLFTTARPAPTWILQLDIDPEVDKGITGVSDGLTITNPTTVTRHRKGNFETDGAKFGAGEWKFNYAGSGQVINPRSFGFSLFFPCELFIRNKTHPYGRPVGRVTVLARFTPYS